MNSTCPLWVSQQFADPTKIMVYVFEDRHGHKKYAIEGIDAGYFGWYDKNGQWLFQTMSDKESITDLEYTYIGQCKVKPVCQRPEWIRRRFRPDNKYRVDLYQHKTFGPVCTIVDKSMANVPTIWYSLNGQELYVQMVPGWDKQSQKDIFDSQDWSRSITYVGLC